MAAVHHAAYAGGNDRQALDVVSETSTVSPRAQTRNPAAPTVEAAGNTAPPDRRSVMAPLRRSHRTCPTITRRSARSARDVGLGVQLRRRITPRGQRAAGVAGGRRRGAPALAADRAVTQQGYASTHKPVPGPWGRPGITGTTGRGPGGAVDAAPGVRSAPALPDRVRLQGHPSLLPKPRLGVGVPLLGPRGGAPTAVRPTRPCSVMAAHHVEDDPALPGLVVVDPVARDEVEQVGERSPLSRPDSKWSVATRCCSSPRGVRNRRSPRCTGRR